MHMLLRVIVEAESEMDAIGQANHWFEENLMHHNGGPFDYCKDMRESESRAVAGSGRWTDYQDGPAAFPVDSERGREEIKDAWETTVERMEETAEKVFEAISGCDGVEDFTELLLEDEDLIRYRIKELGESQGSEHFLYYSTWSSSAINTYRGWNHVQDVMDEAQDSDEQNLWVVPLDAHY